MKRIVLTGLGSLLCLGLLFDINPQELRAQEAPAPEAPAPEALELLQPPNGAVVPRELDPPLFRWKDETEGVRSWRLSVEGQPPQDSRFPLLRPQASWWKAVAQGQEARFVLEGLDQQGQTRSRGTLLLRFDSLPEGELLYFMEQADTHGGAGEGSSVKWRLGPLNAEDGGKVLHEGRPACGACNGFSKDGATMTLGLPRQGKVAASALAQELTVQPEDLVDWEGLGTEQPDFGALGTLSPDGRFLVAPVADRLALVPSIQTKPLTAVFQQVRGRLAFKDRRSGKLALLPGASDPNLVQGNPAFSPDGKTLVFVRGPVITLAPSQDLLLTQEESEGFLPLLAGASSDLYTLEFNEGAGGEARPLKGASSNGARSFYPRWSPDGKWLVFCRQQQGGDPLNPSRLFVLPSQGGEARELACNRPGFNTWHSFSGDGRWLVFSAGQPDQPSALFLARFQEDGTCSPAIQLERFGGPGLLAEFPEFLHKPIAAPKSINASAATDPSDQAAVHLQAGSFEEALKAAQARLAEAPEDWDANMKAALALIGLDKREEADSFWAAARKASPENISVALNYGNYLLETNRLDEALVVFDGIRELDPTQGGAYLGGGVVKFRQGLKDESIGYWLKAVEIDPKLAEAHYNLGSLLLDRGNLKLADRHLGEAARLDPRKPRYLMNLGLARWYQGKQDDGLRYLKLAMRYDPGEPEYPDILASMYAENGDFPKATDHAKRALRLATLRNMEKFASVLEQRIKSFEQGKPWRPQEAQPPQGEPIQEPPAGGEARQVE